MNTTIGAKVRKLWPAEAERALTLLLAYTGNEGDRVRLATLKLCDGSIESLEQLIKNARHDYRDLLAWAESPRDMKAGAAPEPMTEEQRRKRSEIHRLDREEYERWLADV